MRLFLSEHLLQFSERYSNTAALSALKHHIKSFEEIHVDFQDMLEEEYWEISYDPETGKYQASFHSIDKHLACNFMLKGHFVKENSIMNTIILL